jgi:hypothetical protein
MPAKRFELVVAILALVSRRVLTADAVNVYLAHKGGASPLLRMLRRSSSHPAGCVAFLFSICRRGHSNSNVGRSCTMRTAAILGILACAGCASERVSLNDRADRHYQREDSRLAAIESLELLKKACTQAGGVVQMRATHGRFPLRASDMKTATCTERPGFSR